MKKLFVLMILAAAASGAWAQAKQTVTKSSIIFQLKNMGISTGGSIGGLQADINFDKTKPESSSISASVDANTINTDNDMRDSHLKSDEFFDAAKYPRIIMKSIAIKHKSRNNYLGTFNVTIKDKTKTVSVPFTYVANGNSGEFKGSFKIKRLDFGVGGKSLVLSDDVTISIDVQTTQ